MVRDAAPPSPARKASAAACALTLLVWSTDASSQAENSQLQEQSSYSSADFDRFAPRTALEILTHVPGFYVLAPDGTRGFAGGVSNILINGQAFSGKSNDVLSELERIPAANVLRIEVLKRDASRIEGVSGPAANIVTHGGSIGGQFAWRPEYSLRYGRPLFFAGSASLNGAHGPLHFTVGLRNDAVRRGARGLKLVTGADGALVDYREERQMTREDKSALTGSLQYKGGDASIANLNLSYGRLRSLSRETSDRTGPAMVDRIRFSRDGENGHEWEVGGDYEVGLTGGRLKLIGLTRFARHPQNSQVVTEFADDRTPVGSRFLRAGEEAENIARAEYRWKRGAEEWLISAERTFNRLEVVGGLYELLPDGAFREAPLPGASGRIEEERGQAALSLFRPIGRKLTLHASLGLEMSKLDQDVAQDPARRFMRPKGFVSLAWVISHRLDINARVARNVDQISFYDYFSSKHLRSGDVTSGNPQLVPPLSWSAEIQAVRNLGAYGTTKLRVHTKRIRGAIDYAWVGPDREGLSNIDHASVHGLDLTGTVNLDPLGWIGAKIDAEMQLQKSAMRDPLTRERRRISNDLVRKLHLALRHDLPRSSWAWGADYVEFRRASGFRLGSITHAKETPGVADLFVENKDIMGFKMRLTALNLLGASDLSERAFFSPWRGSPIGRAEWSVRSKGPGFTLSVSREF